MANNEYRLMKGNEALAEAAIQAKCDAYFGYPITPQSEVLEYLLKRNAGRIRICLTGRKRSRCNQHDIRSRRRRRKSYDDFFIARNQLNAGRHFIYASAQIPCLVVNVNRGGPGLGTIQPSQGDYFQATKGGGHGDYQLIVLAPASVQEMADFVFLGFELADKYRNPVMMLSDGAIGQMMEKVEFSRGEVVKRDKPWATTGKTHDRERNIITSLILNQREDGGE